MSSDFELAAPLARYILSRKQHSALARLVVGDLDTIQQDLRGLEFFSTMPSSEELKKAILTAWLHAGLIQERHRAGVKALGRSANPVYQLMNDNRFEQHSWLWKSVGSDR